MEKKIEIENHAGKVRKCLFCEQYHWHSTKKFRQKIYTVLLFSMNEWILKNRQEYKVDRFYIYMTQYHLKGKTKCEHRGRDTRAENWLLCKGPTVFRLRCVLCHNFWTNYDLDLFSTSKWPSDLQFCERGGCRKNDWKLS